MDKPIIEQMQDSVSSTSDIKESTSNTIDSISESISETKQSLQSSLDDFSNKSVVDAGKEFLDSNSLLAKFAFLVLVFIVFMVILKIAVAILGYFLSPSRSPYLVKGYVNGNENIQYVDSIDSISNIVSYRIIIAHSKKISSKLFDNLSIEIFLKD